MIERPNPDKLSKRVVYLRDFKEGAARRLKEGRHTDRFSTGSKGIDQYLGGYSEEEIVLDAPVRGGFGRREGSEVVLLFGPTKIGKSRLALNLIRPAIAAGDRIGMLVLEDDGEDCYNRLLQMMDGDHDALSGSNILFTPQENLETSWKLTELLKDIERWFVEERLDLILLDHLQFAFENAEAIRGENEYIAQRVFMRDLNHMMKKVSAAAGKGKTLILVSHVNKDGAAKGVGKVVGSGAIAAAATKIIGVEKPSYDELDKNPQVRFPGCLKMTLWGSRHTVTPDTSIAFRFNDRSVVEYLGSIET